MKFIRKTIAGTLTMLMMVFILSSGVFATELVGNVQYPEFNDTYDNPGDFIFGDVTDQELIDDLGFKDIKAESWYLRYVYIANFDNIMKGKSVGVFDPLGKVTMAELACISAKVHSKLMVSSSDIKQKKGEAWYMPYVRYCYENGIYSNDRVDSGKISLEKAEDWNRAAKRCEVAGMLGRCDNFYKKGFINPDVPLTDISDVKESTPFAEEILLLYRSGVAVGDVNMNFSPMQKVSRAEMAAMITRLLHDEFKIELPKG
ncbi:S-layer homology domain-containing protein [Peptoniphilus senegalensis]|uniref:S-layer homology domain-containing protein n=1 Tax=Peptoniphilus senegalensis TaxID=1465757 RepID=A0ABV1J2I7_9FIRM